MDQLTDQLVMFSQPWPQHIAIAPERFESLGQSLQLDCGWLAFDRHDTDMLLEGRVLVKKSRLISRLIARLFSRLFLIA